MSEAMSNCYVSITNQQRKERTPKALKDLIRATVNAVLEYEGVTAECEMSVLLVDDKAIRELNRQFRDMDRPTDVLSFPSGEYPLADEYPSAENGTPLENYSSAENEVGS